MCSSCKYLKINDKKEGAESGALYYCSLHEKYIYANSNKCNNHIKDVNRDQEIIKQVIEESNNYDDISMSPTSLLIIAIILTILGLFMGVF